LGSASAENGTEIDIYGGYKTTFGRFNVDVGSIYYGYPDR
jgi:hypothetical protein